MEDFAERPDRVDVRLWRREASPHRIHRDVAGAKRTPGLDAPVPFVFVQPLNADPGINTKIFAVAASLFEIAMELLNISFDPVVRWPARRHPPLTESRGALEDRLCGTPKPDRNGTLNGQRIDAGIVNVVLCGMVRDQWLGPELTQHLDLLFDPVPTPLKFLAQRIVLDVVPANPNTEAQTSPTQHVDLCGLLGDQGRLALRQDENARHQFELPGHRSEKPEEHHRLMKRMLIGVWPRQFRLPVRMCPEHVVVDEQIVIAELLGGLRVLLDGLWIVTEFCLGKHNAVLHMALPPRMPAGDAQRVGQGQGLTMAY